jgi:hypothetical protein
MHKVMLVAAALVAGAAGVSQTAAAQDVNPKAATEQQQAASDEMKATGMVTKADEQTRQITIGDKTFLMPEESGERQCSRRWAPR